MDAVLKMKPSAYRSMLMGKLGLTKKSKKGRASLYRWGNQKRGEKWINLTVNDKTPTLAREFTKAQIKKAIKIKQEGKMIRWNLL